MTYNYNYRGLSIDDEAEACWSRLSKNWCMSKLIANFIISFEHNYSKYQRYINLELLPNDLFNRLSDVDMEWIYLFKHFKRVAERKNNGKS